MSTKTLEQKRALYAWNVITDLIESKKDKTFLSKILSLYRKLPSMIMHNGLITTVVFLKSKSISDGKLKEEAYVLYSIEYFLKYKMDKKELPKNADKLKDLKKEILESTHKEYLIKLMGMDFSNYRVETSEALRIAQWLKRIAEGEIEDEGKGSD